LLITPKNFFQYQYLFYCVISSKLEQSPVSYHVGLILEREKP